VERSTKNKWRTGPPFISSVVSYFIFLAKIVENYLKVPKNIGIGSCKNYRYRYCIAGALTLHFSIHPLFFFELLARFIFDNQQQNSQRKSSHNFEKTFEDTSDK
jgi:hypothetical protein